MHKSHLLKLLQLADPALPIGGFAHSAALETYVQQGIVHDVETAKQFIVQMLSQSIRFTDAAFVSMAYDAAGRNEISALLALDDECTAVKLPKEMRQASQKLGVRLIKVFGPLCNDPLISRYKEAMDAGDAAGHYCIAFGLFAFAMKIPLEEALAGFYYNAAAGFVTNSVKLVPLSQQHGQELLFSLGALINELTQNSLNPGRELIGLCCSGFDIRSMQHERLYSRLYMS